MAGRPKKDDSREKQYRVRLNDEEDKMLENENDDIYYTYIIKNSSALDCVEQIEKYIDRLLHKQITRDEKIYLIVHITRITTH